MTTAQYTGLWTPPGESPTLSGFQATGGQMRSGMARKLKMLTAGSLCAAALAAAGAGAAEADRGAALGMETCELVVPGTPLSTVGQCGWLEVAENPAEPEGRRIDTRRPHPGARPRHRA